MEAVYGVYYLVLVFTLQLFFRSSPKFMFLDF